MSVVYAQVEGRFVQIDSFEVCGVVLYVCFEPSWGGNPLFEGHQFAPTEVAGLNPEPVFI